MIKILKISGLIVLGLLMIYVGGFFFSAWAQELLIYPSPDRTNEECEERIADKVVVRNNTHLYHQHAEGSDAIVVFYHGNGNIVCDMTFLIDLFEQNDVSYIFPEYTGYSNDGRKATHDGVLENVRETVAYIDEQEYQHVYVIGQSIGSGAASYHTFLKEPERLLLISPFTTLTNVISEMVPIYPRIFVEKFFEDQFDNQARLGEFTGNLTIIHGTADSVIDISQGRGLFESVPTDAKEFFSVEGRGHANVTQSQELRDAIKSITK